MSSSWRKASTADSGMDVSLKRVRSWMILVFQSVAVNLEPALPNPALPLCHSEELKPGVSQPSGAAVVR